MSMSAYDEARQKGEKHSVAITQAVDSVAQYHAGLRVSETELRRILATWRPRGAERILRFERLVWIDEEVTPEVGSSSAPMVLTIRLCERPSYSRHNRRQPKD
jgi:hypothetical protein